MLAIRRLIVVLVATSFALVFAIPGTAGAALATNDLAGALEPVDLAQQLAGSGVTVSNVTFTGDERAAGQFTGGASIIGFDAGVVLSSGLIADTVGPNQEDSVTTVLGLDGDVDLTALVNTDPNNPKETFDATVLEFDFVPSGDEITFQYVFASDEYNEYVYAGVNDVFALFVNGTNCATVPAPGGGTTNVNIDTVNGGNPFGDANAVNSALFRNNDLDDGGGSIDTEMDGLTVVLTCTATVNKNVTNHMKLAIADVGDELLDSNVFIKEGSIVVVNDPPTVDAGGNVAGAEGQAVAITGTANDPDADPLTVTWSYTANLGVDAGTTCSFADPNALSTTVTCTDNGSFVLTLTVDDGVNPPVADTTSLSLINVAPGVTITSPTSGTVLTAGISTEVSASFTDAGSNDTHTCSINWGDGTTTTGTIAGGVCSGSHTYTSAGNRTIGVTVTDDDNAPGFASVGVSVVVIDINQAPTADAGSGSTVPEGSFATLDGTATDPDGDSLTTTWSYVAGAGVDAGATCSFVDANAVDTSIRCTDDGDFTVTLTVDDGVNPPVDDSVTITFTNLDPEVDITTPTAGAVFGIGATVNVSATITDQGSNDTHTCSISWGDGTTTDGVVAAGVCTGSHSYTGAGATTIVVTAVDDDGGDGFDSVGITIEGEPPPNQPPTVDAGNGGSGLEGSAIALDATVGDVDGDTVTTTWSYTPGAGVDAGASCSFGDASAVDTTITCTDDGSYTVTLIALDGVNPPVFDTATVTVANADPTVDITAPAAGSIIDIGTIVSVSATLADAGANDTHTCSIDWGDGETTTGVVTAGVCTGSHVYTSLGLKTIVVTATDDDGGTGSDSVEIDIDAGPPPPPATAAKITGGGFIGGPGPAGVTFGFNVHRDELGTIECSVQITKPGKDGWSFHSDTITTLVVDGTTATWSGTGRLNGTDGYTFEMTVRDLGTGNGPKATARDEVSIVIRDGSGAVVYSSGGLQQTGGGNIVVH